MHLSNYTLYQLVKYHIELTEAMEYSLITYKYNDIELKQRFDFLNSDYKQGFYHEITHKLFRKSNKLTREIRHFIKKHKYKMIADMVQNSNLHSRVQYNKNLYLAYASSNNILQVFLSEEELRKNLDESLIQLIETANAHFNLFCLFNTLNLFVSSKVILLEGDNLYILDDIDRKDMITLLNSLNKKIPNETLLNDTLELVQELKTFQEEDAYELLNKISVECMKYEKDLYSDFEDFTNKLEKEIENRHN